MTRLEFGTPQTVDQALIRLPERSHQLYQTDEVFEHCAHLREKLTELILLHTLDPETYRKLPTETRLIPLTANDMQFMTKISFRVEEPAIAIAQHEYIREESMWADIFPSGDDSYRWWKISKIKPKLVMPPFSFICIENNNQFSSTPTFFRGDRYSEYEIGLLNRKEIRSLVGEITRFGR